MALLHCSLSGLSDGVRPTTSVGDAAADADTGEGGPLATPRLLASNQGIIGGIATNGTYVAWTSDSSQVRVCRVSGCAEPTAVASAANTGHIALSGRAIYYTRLSSSAPEQCTLPSSATDTPTCDSQGVGFDLGNANAFAVDQNYVFVGLLDDRAAEPGHRILSCNTTAGSGFGCGDAKSLGGPSDWNLVASGVNSDGPLALSSTRVYWSSLGASGSIYSCARTGCGTPAPVVTNQGDPRAMVVSGTSVYWTTHQGGTVATCKDDCTGGATALVTNQSAPLGIAFSDGKLYWANETAGTIVRCAPENCSPETIVRDMDRPQWIAIDTANVYFSTAGGSIFSLSK